MECQPNLVCEIPANRDGGSKGNLLRRIRLLPGIPKVFLSNNAGFVKPERKGT
jgi:hypothetical protein